MAVLRRRRRLMAVLRRRRLMAVPCLADAWRRGNPGGQDGSEGGSRFVMKGVVIWFDVRFGRGEGG